MENPVPQSIETTQSTDLEPVIQQIPATPKSNLVLVFAAVAVSAVVFGVVGYYIAMQSNPKKSATELQVYSSPFTSPEAAQVEDSPTVYSNTAFRYSIEIPQGFKTQAIAGHAGDIEASPESRSFILFKDGEAEPYINRYVSFEVFGLAPQYPNGWTQTLMKIGEVRVSKFVDTTGVSTFDVYVVQLKAKLGWLEVYVANTADKKAIAEEVINSIKLN